MLQCSTASAGKHSLHGQVDTQIDGLTKAHMIIAICGDYTPAKRICAPAIMSAGDEDAWRDPVFNVGAAASDPNVCVFRQVQRF